MKGSQIVSGLPQQPAWRAYPWAMGRAVKSSFRPAAKRTVWGIAHTCLPVQGRFPGALAARQQWWQAQAHAHARSITRPRPGCSEPSALGFPVPLKYFKFLSLMNKEVAYFRKYPDSEASPNDPLSTASADSVQQFSGVDTLCYSGTPTSCLAPYLPTVVSLEDPRHWEVGNDLFVLVCSVRGIHLSAILSTSSSP